MEQNRLKPENDVRVETWLDGKRIDVFQGSGFHTVREAVNAAYESGNRNNLPAEDYVFVVTDLTTGTHARYRINAGDNLKILPEETSE